MKLSKASLLGCLLLWCAASGAQEIECDKDKDINACVNLHVHTYARTLRAGKPGAKAADAVAAQEEGKGVAKAVGNAEEKKDQAGTTSSGAAAKSSLTDLIPWLNMLGVLSDSDESDGTIAVDLNFLVQRRSKEKMKHDSQLKWELDVSPKPFDPLVEAIPEGVRTERTKELQEQIKETADSRLQYTFSYINEKNGRDFRQHQGRFTALVAPLIFNASDPVIDAAFTQKRTAIAIGLTNLLGNMRASEPGADGKLVTVPVKPQTLVGNLAEDDRKKLLEFIVQARADYAVDLASRLDDMQKAVARKSIPNMAELVLQQPQILFSATRSFRDDVVGPEALGVKFTYEKSFVDLNGFLKFAKGYKKKDSTVATPMCEILEETSAAKLATPDAAAQSKNCLTTLDEYLETHAEQIENQSRITGSLEFKQVDDWNYALPTDGVDMNLPKHDRVVASIGFGRAIRRTPEKDRIDFDAAFDSNLDDDDTYKSRFVVTLTYTRRFGEMDIPFSIVYANKSEFLEGTDKQIGLHFGIKYRALDEEK